MNVVKTIKVMDMVATSELAGAAAGAEWFKATKSLVDGVGPGLCVIDFSGVRIATVSWLREGVVATIRYLAAMSHDLRLIVTGLADLVREELDVALEATGNVLIAAELGQNLQLTRPVLLGRLDLALHQTLNAIEQRRQFDATSVSRAIPGVGVSAANNRLAALESKGILTSEKRGRSRLYRPLLEDLRYGH